MKKNKVKKHLNYRTLIKVETFLSFIFAAFFLSINITGFAVGGGLEGNAVNAGMIFFLLGLTGTVTLLLGKNKSK